MKKFLLAVYILSFILRKLEWISADLMSLLIAISFILLIVLFIRESDHLGFSIGMGMSSAFAIGAAVKIAGIPGAGILAGIFLLISYIAQFYFSVLWFMQARKYGQKLDKYYWNLYLIGFLVILQLPFIPVNVEVSRYLNYAIFAFAAHLHLRQLNPKEHVGFYHSLKVLMIETGSLIFVFLSSSLNG